MQNNYLLAQRKFFRGEDEVLRKKMKDANPASFSKYVSEQREARLDFLQKYIDNYEMSFSFTNYAIADINYWYGYNDAGSHVFVSKEDDGDGNIHNKCLVLRYSECLMLDNYTPSRIHNPVIVNGCARRPNAVIPEAKIGRGVNGLDYNQNVQVVVRAVTETSSGNVYVGTTGPVHPSTGKSGLLQKI